MKSKVFIKSSIATLLLAGAVTATAGLGAVNAEAASQINGFTDLPSSKDFFYYNPCGYEDTAVYRGRIITLDNLKENYNEIRQKGNYYYNPITGDDVTWKKSTTGGYIDVDFSVDSPLCSFIPKEAFVTKGTHYFLGEEYGYYVNTYELCEYDTSLSTYENTYYQSEVLLFDIDHKRESDKITTTIEVVLQTETVTYTPLSCYKNSGREVWYIPTQVHNRRYDICNFVHYKGLLSNLDNNVYFTVPAIGLDDNNNFNITNPHTLYVGDLTYGVSYPTTRPESDSDDAYGMDQMNASKHNEIVTKYKGMKLRYDRQLTPKEAGIDVVNTYGEPVAKETVELVKNVAAKDYGSAAINCGKILKYVAQGVMQYMNSTSNYQQKHFAGYYHQNDNYQSNNYYRLIDSNTCTCSYNLTFDKFIYLDENSEYLGSSGDNVATPRTLILTNPGDFIGIVSNTPNASEGSAKTLIGLSGGIIRTKSGSITNYTENCERLDKISITDYNISITNELEVGYNSNSIDGIISNHIAPKSMLQTKHPIYCKIDDKGALATTFAVDSTVLKYYGAPIQFGGQQTFEIEFDKKNKTAKVVRTNCYKIPHVPGSCA